MKISAGDGLSLNPQPLPCVIKSKELDAQEELKFNKNRLDKAKTQVKMIKENINKFIQILIKEVGDDTDVKNLTRNGFSPSGWQGRAQMILNLRLRLTAMRSKFLDPPHKMYYRGPFDPRKEFDLKCLPEKQENLYEKLLEEKRIKILVHDKPVDVLKKELDDLRLMHKAARFRSKSLTSKLSFAKNALENSKEKAVIDMRVVEGMIAHQSLYKMMIDPDTFQLDANLKRHVKVCNLNCNEIPEGTKFKMMHQKTEKKREKYKEAVDNLTEKLDKINKNLIEARQINTENIVSVEIVKLAKIEQPENIGQKLEKTKGKDNGIVSPEEIELNTLTQENRCLREFLLSSVLSSAEDFRLFTNVIDNLRDEFVQCISCIRDNNSHD